MKKQNKILDLGGKLNELRENLIDLEQPTLETMDPEFIKRRIDQFEHIIKPYQTARYLNSSQVKIGHTLGNRMRFYSLEIHLMMGAYEGEIAKRRVNRQKIPFEMLRYWNANTSALSPQFLAESHRAIINELTRLLCLINEFELTLSKKAE